MSDVPFKARGLVKRFGSLTAVDALDLEVRRGECFGLLGPNGAGKSTFIAMVYGASVRSQGELEVFGMDPGRDARAIKKRLGIVTQANALDESLTVEENMLLYAAFQGLARGERKARVAELLEYMALSHKAGAKIQSLSGGMQRRLVFVRALLAEPEAIILDEPTTGLDPAVRHLLWSKVKELQAKGTTVLLTTHYMHEAEVLCDRVAIMNQGKIVALDSPRALIQSTVPGYVSVYGLEKEPQVDAWMAERTGLRKYRDSAGLYLAAPRLQDLLDLSEQPGGTPQLMRPSNLEDVFLQLTGAGLAADA